MWDIGVDVVEIEKFKRLDYSNHKEFYNRIFTPREIKYCLSYKNVARHFAATFAGKEAVYKATNDHINVRLHEIEIVREGGIPRVNLMVEGCKGSEGADIQVESKVSLSHSSSYAVAFALVLFKGQNSCQAPLRRKLGCHSIRGAAEESICS